MEMHNRNVTVRNLTEEEARKTYSEMPKETLIEMLIQLNKELDNALSFSLGHCVDFSTLTPEVGIEPAKPIELN